MNRKKYSEMIPSPSMVYDFKVFENWLGGRGVSPTEIRNFLEWAIKNRSPSTAARYKATLKRGITEKYGDQMDMPAHLMLQAFFEQIKIPQPDSKITEVKVVSREERKILRGTSGAKTRVLLQALYETGARVSEILRLRLDDCRTVKGTVYCQVTGKGSKMRTVYLKERTFRKIRKLYNSSTYLFETRQGKPMSRYTAHTLVSRAGNKIGRRLHPHMLRHSRATDLLNTGIPLPAVSTYLGHSSPDITAKFYLHGMPVASSILKNVE